MAKRGKLSRRSFLGKVAGAGLATGAAGIVSGCATTGYTDSDSGPYADPAAPALRTVTPDAMRTRPAMAAAAALPIAIRVPMRTP